MADSSVPNIPEYEVLERIGSGGMATVYRARRLRDDGIVALKVLHEHLAYDRTYAERFRREADAAEKINHPAVVPIFRVGRANSRPFLEMEFVEGSTLAEYLRATGRLGEEQALRIAGQVAAGLAAAHAAGIVHRDLKPPNIMLVGGDVRVMDFGVARIEDARTLTATGMFAGTPAYMSPEQVEGSVATAQSDLYSLGIILYEMLTGAVPFRADTPMGVMQQQLNVPPQPMDVGGQRLAGAVSGLVSRLLAKSPGDRFQAAGELASVIETLRIEDSSSSEGPTTGRARQRPLASGDDSPPARPGRPTRRTTSTSGQSPNETSAAQSSPTPPMSRSSFIGSLARFGIVGGGAFLVGYAAGASNEETPAKVVEVPVEVIKEVRVEVPVEVIKEVTVEVPVERIVTVQGPVEAATAAGGPTPTAVPEFRPGLAGVEIEVRWNGLDPAGQEAANVHLAAFKEESGITIKPDFSDWASSFQKITTGFAAGTAPDIWQGGGLWTTVLAAKGGTLFIDEFVNSWSEWPDFYPVGIEDVTYEGHVHGVPYRFNYRGNPVIRPSVYEAAGMEVRVPRTWDEVNEDAQKLTIRDGTRYEQAGFNLQHSTQVYEDWLIQAGGNTFDRQRTRPTNLNQQGLTALSQHVHFGYEGSMPPEGMDSGIPNLHAFCAGRVAIQQLWPGDLANCEVNAPNLFADVLVGEPFTGPVEQAIQIYVDKYQSYKLTRSPEGVFATLEWLSRPQVNLEINIESRRSMPCRAAMESYDIYFVEPYRQFMANSRFAKTRQVVPQHFDVQPAMGRWVYWAGMGEITVGEALAGMDAEVLRIITES